MLDPTFLANQFKIVIQNVQSQNGAAPLNAQQLSVIDNVAFGLANAIHAYILTAQVNSIVTGTLTPPTAVTGTAIGTIS